MKQFLSQHFNLAVDNIQKLGGYDNENYLITTEDNQFIFKTYQYSEQLILELQAETQTLQFLNINPDYQYPQPIFYKDGDSIKEAIFNNKKHLCRLLTYVKGELLGDIPPNESLFNSFGIALAKLDTTLLHYKNEILESKKWQWDNQYYHLNRKYINDIPDLSNRKIVEHFFQQYIEYVDPILAQLRKSIIHNDANEYNVLAQCELVSGFIDFSDMCHTYLINELAIAMAYAHFEDKEPLKWAIIILKSYHSILPLELKEIQVLYYLIAIRLSVSVCNSSHSQLADPSNTHALLSQMSAWKMLHYLYQSNPKQIEDLFIKATCLG